MGTTPAQFTSAGGTLVGPVNGVNRQYSFVPLQRILLYNASPVYGYQLFKAGLLLVDEVDYVGGPGYFVLAADPGSAAVTALIYQYSNYVGRVGAQAAGPPTTYLHPVMNGASVFRAPGPTPSQLHGNNQFYVYRNGLLLSPVVDFNAPGGLATAWITLTSPLANGEALTVVTYTGLSLRSTSDGTLGGIVNGVNTVFTVLASNSGVAMAFLNGKLLMAGVDYTASGGTFILSGANIPQPGAIVSAISYALGNDNRVPSRVSTLDGTLFNPTASESWVFRDGLLMTAPVNAATSGNAATFAIGQAPASGATVTVDAWTVDPSRPDLPALNLGVQYSSVSGGISGPMNGVNNVFTVNAPRDGGSALGSSVLITQILLWWNGVAMTLGRNYAFAGNVTTISGGAYPVAGDLLTAQVYSS